MIFEPDEGGWVRASIEELPEVIACAPTLVGCATASTVSKVCGYSS